MIKWRVFLVDVCLLKFELMSSNCSWRQKTFRYTCTRPIRRTTKGQLISNLLTSPKKRTDEFFLFAFLLFKQADGALGEPSDKSDFSLHVWDSFSQEIRDLLFIFYGQKSLIYLKCSDFLPKKEEMCYFFIEKREKQNKRRKKS